MAKSNPQRPRPHGDIGFVVFMAVLMILSAVFWLLDPSHRDDGGSRVPWPAAEPHRP